MLNWVKSKKWLVVNVILVGLLLSLLGIQITDRSDALDRSVKIGIGNEKVITLGHVAYAAGDLDYTYDGTDDNVQFQAALNALPVTGGRLVDVSAVQKNFSATVTRAIANVVITGAGAGSYFTNDGLTALFTAGGNGWVFEYLRTDAGSLNMGATTGWMWTDVTINATYYAYRSPYGQSIFNDVTAASITDSGLTAGRVPYAGVGGLLSDSGSFTWNGTALDVTSLSAPTGRAATFMVSASDSPAGMIAQADYSDLATAIAAASDGDSIELAPGTHTTNVNVIDVNKELTIFGPRGAVLQMNNLQVAGYVLIITSSNVTLEGFTVDGNFAGQALAWTNYAGVQIGSGTEDVTLRFMEIKNVGNDAVLSIGTNHRLNVLYNIIRNSGEGILIQNSNYFKVIGNELYDIGTDSNTNQDGIEPAGSDYGLVALNFLYNISGSGIDNFNGSDYNTFANNTVRQYTQDSGGNDAAFFMQGQVGGASNHNRLEGNLADTGPGATYRYTYSSFNTSVGNTAMSPSGANGQGFRVELSSENNTFSGNTVRYASTSFLDSSGYNSWTGNNAFNATIGATLSGGHSSYTGGRIDGLPNDGIAIQSTGGGNTITGVIIDGSSTTTWGITSSGNKDIITGNIFENFSTDARKLYITGSMTMAGTTQAVTYPNILSANTTYIRLNQDLSTGLPITFTLDNQPDVPRGISFVFNSHVNITAYSITVTGVNSWGEATTYTWSQGTGWSADLYTIFATITSIQMTSRTGTGAGDTMSIGIDNALGLPTRLAQTTDVFKVVRNGADYPIASMTMNASYSFALPAAIADGDTFVIWYKSVLNQLN